MQEKIYQSPQTREIIQYVREEYGDELEFLWPKFDTNAIWRNRENRKWYAALLIIPKSKLGFASAEKVEILDLRFYKNEAPDFVQNASNVYPGYHMNKNNWITIILDGSMPTAQILELLDNSYRISLTHDKIHPVC